MEISAIEEAFIRGDWEDVLLQSREKLLEQIAATETRDGTMTQPEEALVSMYLQSVFELARQDEVETAEMVMRSLAPLPFPLSLQWIKFLIAMDNRAFALELLNESLQHCAAAMASAADPSELRSRYEQLTELLVFHVLSPNENPKAVRDYITGDAVLDERTKQRILEAAHATIAPPAAQTTIQAPLTTNGSSHGTAHAPPSTAATTSNFKSKNHRHDTQETEDPSGDLVAIGGTAIAVAALAIGVYRYRDTLRDAVAEIGPAVSKGFADAKYALFES